MDLLTLSSLTHNLWTCTTGHRKPDKSQDNVHKLCDNLSGLECSVWCSHIQPILLQAFVHPYSGGCWTLNQGGSAEGSVSLTTNLPQVTQYSPSDLLD